MVRAILDGSKTQTRRIVKPQPIADDMFSGGAKMPVPKRLLALNELSGFHAVGGPRIDEQCPYGQALDRLWVRETWARNENQLSDTRMDTRYVYRADGGARAQDNGCDKPWKPSIHMPRSASRITLEITEVRVERLNNISEQDAVAEGVRISSLARRTDACYGIYECLMPDGKTHFNDSAFDLYRILWEQSTGPGSWDANPFVWAISFRRAE
jgi:hypothetical protein